MTHPDSKSPVPGALIYFAFIAALTSLALYIERQEWPVLLLGMVGPAISIAEGIGLGESVPMFLAISGVYLAIIFAPTGARLIRGKWNPALIILQILLLLPSLAYAFLALIVIPP